MRLETLRDKNPRKSGGLLGSAVDGCPAGRHTDGPTTLENKGVRTDQTVLGRFSSFVYVVRKLRKVRAFHSGPVEYWLYQSGIVMHPTDVAASAYCPYGYR